MKKAAEKPAPKKPNAAKRTISLFTGKTDLEARHSRDGSPPGERHRPPRVREKGEWSHSERQRRWEYYENGRGLGYITDDREVWLATLLPGVPDDRAYIGKFDSMADATAAFFKKLNEPRKGIMD